MSWLNELPTAAPNSLDENYSFYDADTLMDKEGNSFRLKGFDAPEVSKLLKDKFSAGEAGGAVATDAIAGLAKEQGYTNMKPVIGPDGEPMIGKFGRPIVDLFDESGQSFTDRLLSEGIVDPSKYTDDTQNVTRLLGQNQRQQEALAGTAPDEWDLARNKIESAELAEGAKSLGFKQTAANEVELAQLRAAGLGDRFVSTGTQVDNFDRDIDNRSTNPFSDSWDQGWISVTEAAYGILNMIGETSENEMLTELGTNGVERARARMGEFGSTTLDWKDVDSVGSAFEYLGNNLALSLPYMAATVAGTAAAPATAGASLSLPVALYTGNVWNEMEGENKDPAVAIGAGVMQAALDRLGLKGIVSTTGAPKKMMKDAVGALVKQGITKEAAEQAVIQASRREIASLVGVAKDVAKEQIQAKKVFKDMSARVGVGGVGEAGTEALQEAIGYTAAHHTGEGFDFNELNERMIAGAIAGGALGGGLAAPGAAYNTGAWADIAYRLEDADNTTASDSGQWAEWEKQNYGRIQSINEILAEQHAKPEAVGVDLNQRAEAHQKAQKQKSNLDRFTEQALNVSQLWQGAVRNIFTPELKARSRAARKMADIYGGNLQKVFSGSSFENAKHHQVAIYKNMIDMPENVYRVLSDNARVVGPKKRAAISQDIYKQLNQAVDKDGNYDPSKVTGPHADTIRRLAVQMRALGDQMYNDQKKFNPDLGYINNYLFKYKALNKNAIAKNRTGFQQKLQDNFQMSHAEAKDLIQTILDDPNVADLGEAFSVTQGGIVPGSHRKRSLGLSEKADFQEFMEQDVFANMSQAAKSAARFVAHRKYIGQNGEVVNKLLDEMLEEGVPEVEVNRVAARMKDYLDAESGNYKRPTSELAKGAMRLQKNFMMLSTLANLPLATISSLVESALVHKGLTTSQVFGKEGSLQKMGKEFGAALWQGAGEVADLAAGSKERSLTPAQDQLRKLGFYDWDVGAATVTGVTETNQLQQRAYEVFFKATGLTGWTNFTRAARASIAGDYMTDKAQTLMEADPDNWTREDQEADEALRNLGIDVEQFVEAHRQMMAGLPLSPEMEAQLENDMREGTFNFINDAVALPQSANRPLIYQDPRFALFTQFQGFIATFTANHIPKLWGEYVKRGTPAMKYNAFATMTTMIMLGFASQELKDRIKYGQSSPYLDDVEYIQRGIRASGLLGTGERVLEQFFPIYEQRTEGVADWIWSTTSGESPTLSYAKRGLKAAADVYEGDVNKGLASGLRLVPGMGPFGEASKGIANLLTEGQWNYKGE